MELDDIPLRKVDKDELDKLCVSMIDIGEVEARAKYLDGDPSKNITELRGKWEGYHLVDYAGFVKDKTDDDELEKSYKQFGQSINKTRSHASHGGGKNKEKPRNILKGLATAQNLSLIQCFVDFLEFCARANNGEGLPISIYSYDRHLLMASISKKKAYVEDELVRLDGSSKQEIKKFDGINIFWEQPNNEHEKPCCKIEPCIGQKHLSVPNTFSNIELEQPSTVLGWSSNITDFVGREKEKEKLHKWLNSRAEKSIQLISGEGGVGKTRLAFDFAYNEIDSKEWGAGQATNDLKGRWYMGSKGMLLIVDYPEERETTLKQFLRAISEMGELSAEKRLRVLLLSRNPKFYDVIEEEAPRIQSPAINLKVLETDDEQWALAKNAWEGIQYQHALINEQLPVSEQYPQFPIEKSSFVAWQTNPKQPLNATALMVISLVYYIYCEPDIAIKKPIELTGKSIIRYMTKREIKFIRKEVSYYFGLKKLGNTFELEGVFLLKAVCAISGGFDGKRLKEFIDEVDQSAIQYQLPSIEDIQSINILNGGATYSNGKTQQLCALTDEKLLPALAPDILASDFLVYCLEEYAQKQQAIWVFLATGITKGGDSEDENDYVKENFSKLGRLIFDAKIKLQADYWPVEKLIDELDENLYFCSWIAQNYLGNSVEVHLEHLIHRALTKCLDTPSLSDEKRASYLYTLCFFRGENNAAQTLDICSEAHQIYQFLAKKDPATYRVKLASASRLLANCLSETEFKEKSLKVSKEAISIYEELYEQDSSEYASDLAFCLLSYSDHLSELDEKKLALEASERAVELYTEVDFMEGVGLAFKNMSICLNEMNQKVEALELAEKSVEIYERLAFENPALHSPALASNLFTLAVSLHENNKISEALNVSSRSVELYQSLSKEDSNYLSNLALGLTNLANIFTESNQTVSGIQAARKAIEIYELLEEKNPTVYKSSLAFNLMNLSTYLSRNNQKKEALKVISKAKEYYEELVEINPQTYSNELAQLLETLSLIYSENDQKIIALKVIRKATELYEALTIENPSTYAANLASCLKTLSRRLIENNQTTEAVAVIERSVEIYESLAKTNSAIYTPELGAVLIEFSDCLCYVNKISKALEKAKKSSEIYSKLVEEADSPYYSSMLAHSLAHLSYCLGLKNHIEEALDAARHAVEIYDSLAKHDEVIYQFDLAYSLSRLSRCLGDCNQNVEALITIERCVTIYESLAIKNPLTYSSYLAYALQTLSHLLSANGKNAKALDACKKMVDIFRNLARETPDVYEHSLADSLGNLSACLSEANKKSDALNAIGTAVRMYEVLAEGNPARFNRDLALYTMNFAVILDEANRKQESLTMVTRAIKLYEALVEEEPDTFLEDFALCLSNYSHCLGENNQNVLALKIIKRAVVLYEQLVLTDVEKFTPLHASSLINLSTFYSKNNQKNKSLNVISIAIKTYRELERCNVDVYAEDIAYCLTYYASRLSENNQNVLALLIIQESVERYELLASEDVGIYEVGLANALVNLSNRLIENNQNIPSVEALKRAIELYETLAKSNPEFHLVRLGYCLFEYCKLDFHVPYIYKMWDIFLEIHSTCIEEWALGFKTSCNLFLERARKENNNAACIAFELLLKR